MGGSGGGFFSGETTPDDLRQQVRAAEEKARSQEFDAQISALLNGILSEANNRDVAATQRHLDEIISALGKEIEGPITLLYGGSVAKHTYVDGLSDVDVLVVLNNTDLRKKSPEEVRKYFAERLRERFPSTAIDVGNLAVTVSFSDATIQLLPAIRHAKGMQISSQNGTSWSSVVNPGGFAEKLKEVNQRYNGKVVPTIKLIKTINSQLPEQQQLKGYHIESMAIQIFKSYTGDQTSKAMLTHFFRQASSVIRTPIADTTGQSLHVDDYLGAANSQQRRISMMALDRINRAIRNADGAESEAQWREILGL